ncbi:MAG: ATP-binding protein, partial [Anaerolineae bacterium]|nr:ATP-binding protein [Anaerolineae bacterium]
MAAELQNKRPNPYVGPRSFQTGDKIYGRDWETEELRDLVIAKRIVMLHSPSGAGKTSLIHAALIPALRAENFRILPPIRVGMDPPPAVLKAGCTFNRYVLSAIISLGGTRLDQTDLFKLCSVTLPEYLNYLSSEFERATDPHRLPDELLIFDQFEEILTVDPLDREAKEVFFAQMGEVLRDTPRWALIAMREDYVGSLEPYLHHIPTRLTAHFRLEKLDKQAAYSALEEPVLERGVTYAEGVAERLIEQLVTLPQGKSEFVEPVQLQVVAHALWEYWQQHASEDGTITGEHLAAFGDVEQALSNFYDACIRDTVQKTGVPEHELRRWFDEKMITPAGTRGIVYKGERETEGIPNTAVNVLDHLHIIRVEPRAGADWCEIAHDGFISAIRESNRAFEERLFEQRSRQLLR